MDIVVATTYVSLVVQILTGFIDIFALSWKLPAEHQILRPILTLELIVQSIEFVFYVWFVVFVSIATMAATRYFDWVITTPTMLFTTIVFMKYAEYQERKDTDALTSMSLLSFLREHRIHVATIFLANLAMLALGYLGETGVISKSAAFGGGFVAFAVTFYVIYQHFARQSDHGRKLYAFLVVVWSMYGFAFLLNTTYKNVSINFLDLFAKNFFGLYLVYVMYTVKK